MAIRQEIYVEKAKGYTITRRSSSIARDARTAAEKAKAKGWQTWITMDQCDVLDMATVISQKPNTNWYFVLRLVEEQEQVWKVQADNWKDVTNAWLRYQSALEPSACWEF